MKIYDSRTNTYDNGSLDFNLEEKITPYYRPAYKYLYEDQKAVNKSLLVAITVLTCTVILGSVGVSIRQDKLKAQITRLQGQYDVSMGIVDGYMRQSEGLEIELASCSAKLPKPKKQVGKVGYYSKLGCLGCSPNQKMANGEIFDETKYTLANNQIPLNTWVTVKNLDNGLFVRAKVSDRGGFNKYGRIADLSKALFEGINAKTDKSTIEITW